MNNTSLFEGLRRLDHELAGDGVNKHDRCIALIMACIPGGIDTGKRIVGALAHLGYDRRHVAIMLMQGVGKNPALHRWFIGEDGRYTLHEEAAAAA